MKNLLGDSRSNYCASRISHSGDNLPLSFLHRVTTGRYPLRPGSLVLIEHGDEHEIIAGRGRLETINIYVPPGYTSEGDELPAAKP
jgi:hypothetical protein